MKQASATDLDSFLIPSDLSLQLQQAAENYASSELMRLLDSLEKNPGPNPSINPLRELVRSGQMDEFIARISGL